MNFWILRSMLDLDLLLICRLQGKLVSKLTFGPFLTLSVRNGPTVSFGTNVPWIKSLFDIPHVNRTTAFDTF